MQLDISRRETPDELRCCCLVHLSLPLCLCQLAPRYKYVMMFKRRSEKKRNCPSRYNCTLSYFVVLEGKDSRQFLPRYDKKKSVLLSYSYWDAVIMFFLLVWFYIYVHDNCWKSLSLGIWGERCTLKKIFSTRKHNNLKISQYHCAVFSTCSNLEKQPATKMGNDTFLRIPLPLKLLSRDILLFRGPRWKERIVRGIAIDPNAYAYIWQSQLDRSPN